MSDKILKLSQAQTLYQDLRERVDAKQVAPSVTGTQGQVLGLDSNLDPIWTDQPNAVVPVFTLDQSQTPSGDLTQPVPLLCDKTFDEVSAACFAGKCPYAIFALIPGYLITARLIGITDNNSSGMILFETIVEDSQFVIRFAKTDQGESAMCVSRAAPTVADVQVNGTSITDANGVANVPIASDSVPGVVKTATTKGGSNGIYLNNGLLAPAWTDDGGLKSLASSSRLISPSQLHKGVFYAIAKAAGDSTQSASSNAVGTYTDGAKAAIQNMLGITDLISTEESSTATTAHAINSTFMINGKLYRATAAIAVGDAVEVGTNCEVVKADEVFVKKTDYATASVGGVVKVSTSYGIGLTNNNTTLQIISATSGNIKAGATATYAITPSKQHESIFYGLSKVAGVDLANETVTLGRYPGTARIAIRKMIDALGTNNISAGFNLDIDAETENWILSTNVQDVQINGTSIVNNGIANIPKASNIELGVVALSAALGITTNNEGKLYIVNAYDQIKPGTEAYRPITPSIQHSSVFYGLAKAAGDSTQSASNNAVGTYTETAKSAIRTMLGATSSNVIAVQDEQPTDTDTKVWLQETEAQGIQVPTMEDMANYVQKTDYATTSTAGLVKVGNGLGIQNGSIYFNFATADEIKTGTNISKSGAVSQSHAIAFYGLAKAAGDTTQAASSNAIGTYTNEAKSAIKSMLGIPTDIRINGESVISNGIANISIAISTDVKAGASVYKPLTPNYQHHSVFYGLAKAAGDTTQAASDNAVGTYTTEAKTAIQTMLGVPGDVQVNGTSVVSNGIANIPIAILTNAQGEGQYGLVKINSSNGITIAGDGCLSVNRASETQYKGGSNNYLMVTPYGQHMAVFYGLAKAAGDTTQSASSNAVGTYTTEAKAAIHTMLGIDPASIAAQVDIPLVETVSGTTPTITGQPNVRYVCGEVSTISITPPASGSVDVIFESGSTATTMTVPSTVKWPAWFDATTLEADTTYEILITDGIYGSVMTWAT